MFSRGLCALGVVCLIALGLLGPDLPTFVPIRRSPSIFFEPNRGQAGADVVFVASARGYAIQIKRDELRFSNIKMRLRGANRDVAIVGQARLTGHSHYYAGSERSHWLTDVPHYARVFYRDIYPNIDLVIYGKDADPEFDFVVHPGGDPNSIHLEFPGATVTAEDKGSMSIAVGNDRLHIEKPSVYQVSADGRQMTAGSFTQIGERDIGFRLGSYDPTRTLVIDPVLSLNVNLGYYPSRIALDAAGNTYVADYQHQHVYKYGPGGDVLFKTFLQGAVNMAIATDAAGSVYLTGTTTYAPLATPGALNTPFTSGTHVFVAKLSSDGKLIYAAIFGGSGIDLGLAIAVDLSGNAVVVGSTSSPNFPPSPLQPLYGGGSNCTFDFRFGTGPPTSSPCGDAFVAKLNATGSALVFSTYLGGSDSETAEAVVTDSGGSIYVAGTTGSANFPVSQGAYQPAVHGRTDGYVTKLAPDGKLVYSTYLGGSFAQGARAIAVDSSGRAWVGGDTISSNFPVTADAYQRAHLGNQDVFLSKLSADGASLVYSTFLGGSNRDTLRSLKLDSAGNPHLFGETLSPEFPQVDPFQDPPTGLTASGGLFISKFNSSASQLLLSTHLPSDGPGLSCCSGYDMAVDAAANIYVAAFTRLAIGNSSIALLKFNPQISVRLQSYSPTTLYQLDEVVLTVTGISFQPNYVLQLNGQDLRTTYVSSTTLTAPAQGPLAIYGSLTLRVPGPNGGSSNSLPLLFSIPLPQLTSIAPSTVRAGGPRFVLDVRGSGFLPTSQVVLNNQLLPNLAQQTTFVNRNQLQATVFADQILSAGLIPVAVSNGGGVAGLSYLSNSQALAVVGSSPNPITAVVNAASFTGAVLTTGSLVSVFGTNLAASTATASSLPLPTTLGGVTVQIAGTPASLLYVSPTQINLLVPPLPSQSAVPVSVLGGAQTASLMLTTAAFSPGIFTTKQTGMGQGAILISGTPDFAAPSGSIPGANARPVPRGQYVSIYCTGLGPIPSRRHSAFVTVGGQQASVSYAGPAPGYAGLYQINALVPTTISPGDALPVVVSVAEEPGQLVASNTVTIAVQ